VISYGHESIWEQLVIQNTNGVAYFLGLIKCPKVGGPGTLAAHKGKKVGGPPAQPNSFRRLWVARSPDISNA